MRRKFTVLVGLACAGEAVGNVFLSRNSISNSLRQWSSLLTGAEIPEKDYDVGDGRQLNNPDDESPSESDDKLPVDNLWTLLRRKKGELVPSQREVQTSGAHTSKKWELVPHLRVEQMANANDRIVSKIDHKLPPGVNTGKNGELVRHRRVVDQAKEDVLQMLHKELRKDLFAEDVKVIEWTGAKVEGSGPVKMLLRLLRKIHMKFVVKEDIQVDLISHGRFQPSDDILLMAQYRLQLSTGKVLFPLFGHEDDPLFVLLKVIVRFTGNGKIDLFFVEQCLVNRRRLVWPELELYDGIATNLKKVRNWAQEENLFNVLMIDIPSIFRKEPRWEAFTEDFKVIDQTGIEVTDMGPKLLPRLLRRMYKKFAVKDDIKVELINCGRGCHACLQESSVVARCDVQLGGMNLPLISLWHKDTPLRIEATFVFHINDQRKVDYMLINECRLNGDEMIWPDVKLSESPHKNLKRIEAWGKYLQNTRGSSR